MMRTLISTASDVVADFSDIGELSPNAGFFDGLNVKNLLISGTESVWWTAIMLTVAVFVITALVWGFGSFGGGGRLKEQGGKGIFIALGVAILIGGATQIIGFFLNMGDGLGDGDSGDTDASVVLELDQRFDEIDLTGLSV